MNEREKREDGRGQGVDANARHSRGWTTEQYHPDDVCIAHVGTHAKGT